MAIVLVNKIVNRNGTKCAGVELGLNSVRRAGVWSIKVLASHILVPRFSI